VNWSTRCDVLWKLDPNNERPATDRLVVDDVPEPLAAFLVATWNAVTLGRYYYVKR
jgi:hypothetical protein